MNKQHLQALLDRVTDGTLLPSAERDFALVYACFPRHDDMFVNDTVPDGFGLIMDGSLDAAVAFVQATLPGWAWMFGECSLSSDARVFPDFNSPIHGERLAREFPQLIDGVEWSEFTDVDLRPSGNPARALLMSALTALIAVAE